jgi:hypothetical protein
MIGFFFVLSRAIIKTMMLINSNIELKRFEEFKKFLTALHHRCAEKISLSVGNCNQEFFRKGNLNQK